MPQLLQHLKQASWGEIIILGLIVNVLIYLGSIGIYRLLNLLKTAKPLGEQQRVLKSDILLSIVTVVCNTIVFVFGVFLWQINIIRLSETDSWWYILAEVLILTLLMDILMYIFHRFVHTLTFFQKIHNRHHDHVSTNMLSLFVLHPVESIGFGMMMLVVICVFPFSAIGISIYLLINSLWGTVGHLNITVLPQALLQLLNRFYVCTSEFHYMHHQQPEYNFGFYFSVWDRIFGTLHPILKKEVE